MPECGLVKAIAYLNNFMDQSTGHGSGSGSYLYDSTIKVGMFPALDSDSEPFYELYYISIICCNCLILSKYIVNYYGKRLIDSTKLKRYTKKLKKCTEKVDD
jgi:hypothetical protein